MKLSLFEKRLHDKLKLYSRLVFLRSIILSSCNIECLDLMTYEPINLINSLENSVRQFDSEFGYQIRSATESDVKRIVILCRNSILNTCCGDYNPAQLNAWAFNGFTTQKLSKSLCETKIFFTEDHNGLIGVGSLSEQQCLDLLYIHFERQGYGYGQKLLHFLELIVKQKGYKFITSYVSKTAKSFFQKNGYKVLHEQQVNVGNQLLTNFKMKKSLIK